MDKLEWMSVASSFLSKHRARLITVPQSLVIMLAGGHRDPLKRLGSSDCGWPSPTQGDSSPQGRRVLTMVSWSRYMSAH